MPFTAPDYTSYYNQANKDLASYYETILSQEKGDLDKAIARLKEDYTKGVRINTEDYARNIAFGQESYQASLAEQGQTSKTEQRQTQADLLSRGVSRGGLATGKYGDLAEKQKLRREAIDRALRKSEEDLKYAKERGIEDTTITQRRGTEDVSSQWAKFQTEKAQERQEKALQLGEQAYQRDFAKKSTEQSFKLQEDSLAKMG